MRNIEFIRDGIFIRKVVLKPVLHIRCARAVCVNKEIIYPSVPFVVIRRCMPSELACQIFLQSRPTGHSRVRIVVYGIYVQALKQTIVDAHTVKAVIWRKQFVHVGVVRPNKQVIVSNTIRAVLLLIKKLCPSLQIFPSRRRFPCRRRIVHRQRINCERFRKPYVNVRIKLRSRRRCCTRRIIRQENHTESIFTRIVIIRQPSSNTFANVV